MSYPVLMVPAGDVIPIMFGTYAGATGASITMTGLAVTDIEIYKDGGVTQRASDAGYTLLDTDGIDFDGITGIHGFSINTGDNTDAGFYTVGAWFTVVVSAVTVDSQTVSFIAAMFRLMASESVAGVPEVDLTHINGVAQTATLDDIEAQTDDIGVAGAGLTAVNVASLSAGAITAAAIATDAIDDDAIATGASAATAFAAGAIDAAALAADAGNEIADAILTRQMTEAYNADGVAPTVAQALFVIMQMLTEMAISGTTMTIKKLDGSTTALTLTLNDATNPTSITRTT